MAAATGMAAVSSVYISFLSRGDHVVATNCLYGSSRVILESELTRYGVETTFVDSSELPNIEKAMRPATRMIFVETPMNPSMKITDLAGAAADREKTRRSSGRRQYFCKPIPPAADRVWRRYRYRQPDEVHKRPCRRDRRDGGNKNRRTLQSRQEDRKPFRRDDGPPPGMAHPEGSAHSAPQDREGPGKRHEAGPVSQISSQGNLGKLSRTSGPPTA